MDWLSQLKIQLAYAMTSSQSTKRGKKYTRPSFIDVTTTTSKSGALPGIRSMVHSKYKLQVTYYKIVFYIIINKLKSHFEKFIVIEELYNRKIQEQNE